MFEALIIACHVGAPGACIQIDDTRGPHQTQTQCEQRLGEMTKDLMTVWTKYRLPFVFKGHYCTIATRGEQT